jgi:hypothetical protein
LGIKSISSFRWSVNVNSSSRVQQTHIFCPVLTAIRTANHNLQNLLLNLEVVHYFIPICLTCKDDVANT